MFGGLRLHSIFENDGKSFFEVLCKVFEKPGLMAWKHSLSLKMILKIMDDCGATLVIAHPESSSSAS